MKRGGNGKMLDIYEWYILLVGCITTLVILVLKGVIEGFSHWFTPEVFAQGIVLFVLLWQKRPRRLEIRLENERQAWEEERQELRSRVNKLQRDLETTLQDSGRVRQRLEDENRMARSAIDELQAGLLRAKSTARAGQGSAADTAASA